MSAHYRVNAEAPHDAGMLSPVNVVIS